MIKKIVNSVLLVMLAMTLVGVNYDVKPVEEQTIMEIDSMRFANIQGEYQPGQILIKYQDPNDSFLSVLGLSGKSQLQKDLESIGITSYERLSSSTSSGLLSFNQPQESWYIAYLNEDDNLYDKLIDLGTIETIKYAEPNYVLMTTVDEAIDTTDPLLIDQNYLTTVKIPESRELLASLGINPGGSRDVVVAVIDTGVDYNHPDLAPNMWLNTIEASRIGIDDDDNGYIDDLYGISIINNQKSGNPMDDAGHGTHVAGIIAAKGDNGIGIRGVADNVKIMAIKAGKNDGTFLASDVAAGIMYAYEKGADVINMSFGSYSRSQAIEDALKLAYSKAVLVASAGNHGNPNGSESKDFYPAAYPWVIGVMAADETGRAPFSNYDSNPNDNVAYEVLAPGIQIMSTLPNGEYAKWSGTSMSAPIVSGIAALLRSKFNEPEHTSSFITGQIIGTANPFDQWVMVDAYRALMEVPKPTLMYDDFYIIDELALYPNNIVNGIADAGDTIQLGLGIKNYWGMASNVNVTIEVQNSLGETNPYVTLINSQVNYGTIGSFSTATNGVTLNSSARVTNIENPFILTFDPNTPNGHRIRIVLTMTANNGMDDTDTAIYSFESIFEIEVKKAIDIPNVISEDQYWTKDNFYVISESLIIEEGVTVRVQPGTKIQFWPSDTENTWADDSMVSLVVNGAMYFEGTELEPIEIYPSESFYNYEVKMQGNIYLSYVKITNPVVYAKSIDHAYFTSNTNYLYYKYISSGYVNTSNRTVEINAPYITNSIFHFMGNINISGWVSDSLFDSTTLQNMIQGENNVFLNNIDIYGSSKNYGSSGINPDGVQFSVRKIQRNDVTGKTYIIVSGYSLENSIERYARYLGGHLAVINDQTENEYIRSMISGNTVIGLKYDNETRDYDWVDDKTSTYANWNSTLDSTFSRYASIKPDGTWINRISGVSSYNYALNYWDYSTHYMIELPGDIYINDIILPKTKISLGHDSHPYAIEYYLSPFTASPNDLVWSSDNEAIITVDQQGTVTPVSVGVANVTVQSTDGVVLKTIEITVIQTIPLESITLVGVEQTNIDTDYKMPYTLTPFNTTELSLIWTSSDTEIAIVDRNGIVRGLRPGNVTITVLNVDQTISASWDLDIVSPVTGIKFAQDFQVYSLDALSQLIQVDIYPFDATNQNIVWETGNEKVAYVDETGHLVIVGLGTVVIRATAQYTNIYDEIIISISSDIDSNTKFVDVTSVNQEGNDNIYRIYALSDDGYIWYWGMNSAFLPQRINSISNITEIKGSGSYLFALDINGKAYRVYPSGSNNSVQSVTSLTPFMDISHFYYYFGQSYELFLKDDGTVWGRGINMGNYSLMDSTLVNYTYDFIQLNGVENVKEVIALSSQSVFLLNDGTVYASNNVNNEAVLVPIGGLSNIISIKRYEYNSYNNNMLIAKDNQGNFYMYNGSYTATKVDFSGIDDPVIEYAYNGNFHIALTSTGKVYTKGDNNFGQLGLSHFNYTSTYTEVSIDNAIHVFLTRYNATAITSDGSLYIWGLNSNQQIGDLSTANRAEPHKVMIGVEFDTIKPTIESTTPVMSSSNASIDQTILVDLTEAVIKSGAFSMIQLKDSQGAIISTLKTQRLDKLIIDPLSSLRYGETYTVSIPSGSFVDYFMNSNDGAMFSFTTEPLVTFARTNYRVDINDQPTAIQHTINTKWTGGLLFTSLNETVATVSEAGVITPIGLGETKVIVSTPDGKYSYQINVEVIERIMISSIDITQDSMVISTDQTKRVPVLINPTNYNEDITYEIVGDEGVASIDEYGFVTGIMNGTVTVKARNLDGTIFDQMTLTVIEPIEKVEFDEDFMAFPLDTTGVNLNVNLYPETATNKTIIWESGDRDIAYVDETGQLIVNGLGTVVIRATAEYTNIYDEMIISISSDINTTTQFVDVHVLKERYYDKYTVYALDSDGFLWSWGNGVYLPKKLTNYSNITSINSSGNNIVAIDSSGNIRSIKQYEYYYDLNMAFVDADTNNIDSYYYHLAVREDGTVWAWGYNRNNRMMEPTLEYTNTYVQLNGVENIKQVVALQTYSIFLSNDGYVYRSNTTDNTLSKVTGLKDITEIKRYNGSTNFFVAKDILGRYYVSYGTDSTIVDFSALDGNVIDYTNNAIFEMALTDTGKVYVKGSNSFGQLGLGDTTHRGSFVELDLPNVVRVFATYYNAVALTSDGSLYIWGNNITQQIGDLTTNHRLEPFKAMIGVDYDIEKPYLDSGTPSQGSTGASIDATIVADLSEAVIPSSQYINFRMIDSQGNIVAVQRTMRLDKAYLDPIAPLKYGETYTVIIPENAFIDYFKNTNQAMSFSFTTELLVTFARTNYRVDINDQPTAIQHTINTKWTGGLLFTSLNESVATVSETGVITPIGLGETKVIVSTPDGKYSYQINVEVIERIMISSIDITQDSMVISTDQTQRVPVLINPTNYNEDITYEIVGDEGVASIDEYGFVTGLMNGTVTVKARNLDGTIFDQMTLTVIEPVEQLYFDEQMLLVDAGSEPVTINVNISPATATDQTITWKSSNDSIAYFNELNQLVAVTVGTVKVRATNPVSGVFADIIVSVKDAATQSIYVVDAKTTNYGSTIVTLMNDGSVWAWGTGILGRGISEDSSSAPIKLDISNVVAIETGIYSTRVSAITSDGKVYSFGENYAPGNEYYTSQQFMQANYISSIVDLSLGSNHSLALKSDGTVYAWGRNGNYQLGDGSTSTRSTPIQVIGLSNIIDIVATEAGSYALSSNGSLYKFGHDGSQNNTTPTLVEITQSLDIKSIYRGRDYYGITIITNDNKLYSLYSNSLTQYILELNNRTILSGSMSYNHMILLLNDGSVMTYGANQYGQLGDGTFNYSYTFREIELNSIINISAGYNLSTAIDINGKLYAWGINNVGQLADFTTINSNVPKEVIFGALPDTFAPTLVSITPENTSINATPEQSIELTFNEALRNASNYSMIRLLDPSNNLVSVNITIDWNKLIIDPIEPLTNGLTYNLSIPSSAVSDLFGNLYSGYSMSFTVEQAATSQNVLPSERFYWINDMVITEYQQFVDEGYLTTLYNNAILNNITNLNPNSWMRFYAHEGSYEQYMTRNYWGTDDAFIINQHLFDYNDQSSLVDIVVEPYLTSPNDSMYPFVADVQLNTATEADAYLVGAEDVTIQVTFNRSMDSTVPLKVSFGPAYPYTQNIVFGRWIDSLTWEGKVKISPMMGNGKQYFSISNGRSSSDQWLTLGIDEGRFAFEVSTYSAEAMNLQATGSEGRIELSWMQDEFVTLAGYNIYRSTNYNGQYVRINSTLIAGTTTNYYDYNVSPGITYYYKFTVMQTDLSESDYSNVAISASYDTILPTIYHKPITRSNVNQSIYLTVTATDNIGVDFVYVYYRLIGVDTWSKEEMSKGLNNRYTYTFDVSQVELPGLEYYIEVTDGISQVYSGSTTSPHVIQVEDFPTIESITPNNGTYNSDTLVTLTGTNFKEGAKVYFSNQEGLFITYVDSNTITVQAPRNIPMKVDVKVVNPFGDSHTVYSGYEYYSNDSRLSIENLKAGLGQEILVPVKMDNVYGLLAADFDINYDAEGLTLVDVLKGNVATKFSLIHNVTQPGTVKVSMASSTSISGSGDLVYLKFKVSDTTTLTSITISISNASLNSNSLGVTLVQGDITIAKVYQFSGLFKYYSNNALVKDVQVSLNGLESFNGISNEQGVYVINEISEGGYTINATKSDEVSGITAYDASLVLRRIVGLETFSTYQTYAADVNRDGQINSMDASLILQYVTGLKALPFEGSDRIWTFVYPQETYQMTSSISNQNIVAILIGDVSGNYSSDAEVQWIENEGVIQVGPFVDDQTHYSAPVFVKHVGYELYAIETTIVLSEGAQVIGIELADSLKDSFYAINQVSDHTIKIAIASATAMNLDEALVHISFLLDEGVERAEVLLTTTLLNENNQILEIRNVFNTNINIDFNLDGIVDAKDMAAMIVHFNESYRINDISAYDLNHDGIIDIYDLVRMNQQQG